MFDLPEQGIRLRGFEGDKDMDQIVRMHNDREIAALISTSYVVPPGLTKLREDYKKTIENSTEIFCIIETIPESSEDEVEWVGFLGLFGSPDARLRRESAYSISIWKKYWNKGYGTAVTEFIVDYAFESLFMHRIALSVFEGNNRAVAVYQKCGFILEGRARKAVRSSDGGWKDIINMGIIVDDWIELKKRVPGQA
ncbi:acyl-CoA N-acyltransferase [Gymnopilus junonius]|uniref:Acyl-CoA N-acyltransferase n=1 Tax=Gymnopilus junonius TaxID=109634 RepID=A0A9P5NBA7_GYMJU|nr:acyl-CoA N-acyltransferase [Gymnopilus junonius]